MATLRLPVRRFTTQKSRRRTPSAKSCEMSPRYATAFPLSFDVVPRLFQLTALTTPFVCCSVGCCGVGWWKAAFLGLSVDEYEEMLAPLVYMCTIEQVPFRTRPELEAFRADGATANEGEFLQQQEAKEVVTGL